MRDVQRSHHGTIDSTNFVFRPVRTIDELRASLALRYEVFSQVSEYARFKSFDHGSRLDLDPFDAYAHHFGLFIHRRNSDVLVGSMRVVFTETGPWADALRRIVQGVSRLERRLATPRPALLPSCDYFRPGSNARVNLDSLVLGSRRCGEPGRYAISAHYRTRAARHARRLSWDCIESAWAWGMRVQGLDRTLISCLTRLSPLYERCGFTRVELEGPADVYGLGEIAVLQATPEDTSPALRDRITTLDHEWRTTGQTVFRVGAEHALTEHRALGAGALAAA